MPAPWEENQYKVVVEFLKTNEGTKRLIRLKHSAAAVPPQLQARVSPATWHAFMTDMEQAAREHPYVVNPSAGRVGSWVACGALMAVVGFCCINPDGGDYNVWLPQVQSLIDRHAAAFAAGGCRLSLQRAQQSYWVQIDVDPHTAVGQPVPPKAMDPAGYPGTGAGPSSGYPPNPQQKPGYEPGPVGGAAKPGY